MLHQILLELLGDRPISSWITSFIFISIGICISLYVDSLSRNKNSPRTPINFSFSFLIKDNLLKIFISFLVVFVTIRFSKEILDVELTHFKCLLLGLGFDLLLTLPLKYRSKGISFINSLK